METHGFKPEFSRFLGKSGCVSHPPKLCASLVLTLDAHIRPRKVPDFKSTVFEMEDLKLAGNTEKVPAPPRGCARAPVAVGASWCALVRLFDAESVVTQYQILPVLSFSLRNLYCYDNANQLKVCNFETLDL